MIRFVYTCFLYVLMPVIVLRLYWKSRRLPAYRHRILERLTLERVKKKCPVDVWIHAVSLGEVVAATPLIDAMLAKQWCVLVTTMTPTGSAQVIKHFKHQVLHQYLPYDLPWCLRRFFKKYHPRLGIVMETELWPNVIDQAKRESIPLLLINARLSDRAFKQYQKVDFVLQPVLNQLTAILAQSDEDARRFIRLGASEALVQVVGNMKFDVPLFFSEETVGRQLKARWGGARTVMIAASTHDNEEQQLLSHLPELKVGIPDLLLLLVPRHPERFQAVFQGSQRLGFKTGLRSQPETIDVHTEVVVVDSMGELLHFYQQSDYAFVGGSLVPIGGHNVLEPIALKVPVFCGPYMQNSKAICQALQVAGAITIVANIQELVGALTSMYQHPLLRQQQIKQASMVLESNRGTLARCMERIEQHI
jgi:3-deoxy-D-manno-octulosonic-acid transferase